MLSPHLLHRSISLHGLGYPPISLEPNKRYDWRDTNNHHVNLRTFYRFPKAVEDVAYKLELPEELSRVHNTFHLSNLKKCHADEPLAVPLDGLHFDDKLQFAEEPVNNTDHEVKRLKQSLDDEVFSAEEQPMPATDSPTHQSPGYILESDPKEDPEEDDEEDSEEDPADYPADRGDDRDDEEPSDDDDDDAEEEEHLAPADLQRGTVPLRGICKRLLALKKPTPPPSARAPPTPPSLSIPSPLPQINPLRHYLYHHHPKWPSYVEDLWDPSAEAVSYYPVLHTRPDVSELVLARQDHLGDCTDPPRRVNQRVIELATTVDQEDEIIYSQLDDARTVICYRELMIELQRQQGPAKDPAEPKLPEEASSSS
ncbi:hypothetical protein Tco_0847731 [Tanacetum coccineum]